jgi:hypothetical protein
LQLRHLHGRLRIEPRLLELLCGRLQSKLALLARELARERCLLRLELCRLLTKAGLLRGRSNRPSAGRLRHLCGLLA